ncbi:glycosyl hydrolase family 25 lysozyme [Lysobacter enzymogenes]|uniref:Glycosyl hydrolase family 25 lysozyme n=1 Tax=Lysobacter enzymogenes TaxID=69 RepID=A0A0S2DMQ0_LYSEN|nr:GH25 family lysozyme [Lysobacter enzymogenes]ALN59856.1 glycosyl hydrolase family 25 lysozyme [Lysobacter enzymogenes]UZW61390.1 GH25 family lysozyme [Lysobacter enzymogenes]
MPDQFDRTRWRRIAMRTVAVAATALAIGIAARWWFLHWQPDRARYPLRGIDVSHHQGAIDWRAVARDDVAFAYLKASEGGDHRDRRYAANARDARAAGVAVGAYHFFTFCRDGGAQAANFLAAAPAAADALPPAVDLEFGGNCGRRPDGAAMRAELDAFLAPVEAAYGKPALLYVTPEFFDAYRAALPSRPLWRRAILRAPDSRAAWTLWQYHNRARVAGIDGPVDLNVFDGDAAAFARWRDMNAQPRDPPAGAARAASVQ